MPMSRLPVVLLLSLFALPLVAQDKPADGGDAKAGGGKSGKGSIQAADQESVDGVKEEGGPEGTGKEGFTLDKAPRVLGARGHCRFDGAVQPKRLLPGQTGTLLVTMMLEGDSVMTSPSTLTLQEVPGSIPIGQWSLRPPTQGRVAQAYLGQPVYDNWAVMEVSVSMPSESRLGEKRNVVLALEFDLHSGSTGQPLGHFRENYSVAVEVGASAKPGIQGQAGQQAGSAAGSSPAGAVKASSDPEGNEPGREGEKPANASPNAAELAEVTPVAPVGSGDAESGTSPDIALEAEDSSSPYLIGAGVLVGVVLALLLARRQR